MKYMILVYASQRDYDGMTGAGDQVWTGEEFAAMGAFMASFAKELEESGELVETRGLTAPSQAKGGDSVTVKWTVENAGNGVAQPMGWIDTVYLTNDPTDPLDPNPPPTNGSMTRISSCSIPSAVAVTLRTPRTCCVES